MKNIINYPVSSLTFKKMFIGFVFVLIGFGAYSTFTYIAYHVSGLDIHGVWEIHGLFPVPIWAKTFPSYISERGGKFLLESDWSKFNIYGKVLWFVGLYLLLYSYFSSGIGISRLVVEDGRGDPFYPLKEALKESFVKSGLFITLTLTLLLSFSVVFVLHFVVAVPGNIRPLFYPVSIFVIILLPFLITLSLLFVYMLMGFAVSILVGPVVATSMEGDTFDILYEGFSIINERGLKFAILEILSFVVKIISFSIFTFAVFKATSISGKILTFVLPRFKFIFYPHIDLISLPQLPPLLSKYFSIIIPGEYFVPHSSPLPSPPSNTLAWVVAFWMVMILMTSFAFYISLTWTGRTYVYANILKDKDGVDIFKTKPKLLDFKPQTKTEAE